MRRAEYYLEAAQLVDESHLHSCTAVSVVTAWQGGLRERYADMFMNEESEIDRRIRCLSATSAEAHWGKEGRVIALCFAAAMAETGDL